MRIRPYSILLVASLLLAPSVARTDPVAPVEATQVFYASAEIGTTYSYILGCDSTEAIADVVEGYGIVVGSLMLGSLHTSGRQSAEGDVIQAGGVHLSEDRKHEETTKQLTGFTTWAFGGVGGSSGPFTMWVTWALWGGSSRCSLEVDGESVEVHELSGSHAIYAGPEAFTGGLYEQHGASQTAVGRVFARRVERSVVFASLIGGSPNPDGPTMSSSLVADDPLNERTACGWKCDLTTPDATTVVASVSLNGTTRGEAVSQFYMIDIPL